MHHPALGRALVVEDASTSSWASRSWITSVLSSRLARSMCRRNDSYLGGPTLGPGAEVVEPGLADRAHPVVRLRQPLDLGQRLVEPPAAASRGASLGCSATPATSASCSLARPRPPSGRRAGRSRSARSGVRRPPPRAASASRGRRATSPSRDVEVAVVVDDRVRQRLGQRRPLAVARAARRPLGCASARVIAGSAVRWTASYTTRLGTPARAGHVDDRLLARSRRRPRASATGRAQRSPGRRRPSGRAAPATTIVTSPRTPSLGPARRARPAGRGVPPRGSWSARGRPPPAGRRRTPRPSPPAPPAVRCGASKNTSVRSSSASAGQPAGPLARLARQEALEAEPVDRQPARPPAR